MNSSGVEHIATTTLTAFEWAVIIGLGGMFTLAIGFFLSRLIKTLDKLDDAVGDLRETLAKEYVTKDDFNRCMKELKQFLVNYVRSVRMRTADACNQHDCPMKGEAMRSDLMAEELEEGSVL